MERGNVSAIGVLSGFLLLTLAGILAFTSESPLGEKKPLRGRLLQYDGGKSYYGHPTGLSGMPLSTSDSSSGSLNSLDDSSSSSKSLDGSKSIGSGSLDDSSSSSMPLESSSGSLDRPFDNAFFGGNHKGTLAPFGFVGGDYVAYITCGVFFGFYAWLYKMQVVEHIQPLPPQDLQGSDDFEMGICDCFTDMCMCLQLVCPCMVYVRQAHTNEVTGVCNFWATFWAYFISGLCCGIGPCCLTVYFRMRLKAHMGIEDHPVNDLCCAWAFVPCAVGQQAMAVDRKLGYEVELCCNLLWLQSSDNAWKDEVYEDRYEDYGDRY